MKSFIPIVTTTLLWLGTTSLLATTVHADKVVASQLDLGSPKESGRMLVSTVNDGDTHEETGRMLKKDKKTSPPAKKKKGKSNAPSKKPSSLLQNTIVKGPSTHRAGTQACNVYDEDTPPKLNRYQYCQLFGITDANCQSTNAVSGPFYFNRDTGGQAVTFNFERLAGDTEDSVCINIINDPTGSTKGFVELWDDVDKPLSTFSSFSFQWRVKTCPSGFLWDTACLTRLFFQIYTRSNKNNIIYYDCRYTLYLSAGSGGGPYSLNTWYTYSINPNSLVSVTKSSSSSVVGSCPATLKAAADAGYVLGTNNACGDRYPYSMNVGQGGAADIDTGLEVCFKNFQKNVSPNNIVYQFKTE